MKNPVVKSVLFDVTDYAEAADFARSLASEFGADIVLLGSQAADNDFAKGMDEVGFLEACRDVSYVDAPIESVLDRVDMVVVNLGSFDDYVNTGAAFPECIDHIDLQRTALMRAAAKRFSEISVVIDPDSYDSILREMRDNDGATLYETRVRQAFEVFRETSDNDYDVAEWLGRKLGISMGE